MTFETTDLKLRTALKLIEENCPFYTDIPLLMIHNQYNQDSNGEIGWQRKGNELYLKSNSINDALLLIGRALTTQDRIMEVLNPRFQCLAAEIDVSRNSVYTMKTMKRTLSQMALMGFNACYMYMEDTYELPGYPYFGYRRGRYSVVQQKEMDDFAHALGIELIPCIQTLAHLRTAIRWKYMEPMRDTIDNLMVGHEETIKLVEAMIAHFSRTFRSRRIHLGMDEAVSLGTGRYLRYKGYRSHRDILMEHLHTTCELCRKYGLKPMIWDDMVFRDQTPLMNYYGDSEPVTEEEARLYPDNLTFVYWDYYSATQEEYARQLKRRGCLDTIFAGGVWKWGGWAPNFTKSFEGSIAAVEACCDHGISEIIVTLWGDDGDETPLATVLPGLALFGLLRFGSASPSDTNEMCMLLSGTSFDAYAAMEKIDLIPGMPEKNMEGMVPHKLLLYGDIASELFMGSITKEPLKLAEFYRAAANEYMGYMADAADPHLKNIFQMYSHLANAVAARCEAAVALHKGYAEKTSEAFQDVYGKLDAFAEWVKKLHESAVVVWSTECKGEGLEIIDLRLGGVQARCGALKQRMKLYEQGALEALSELEEKELPYRGCLSKDGHTPGRESYGEIVTANTLCHQFSI